MRWEYRSDYVSKWTYPNVPDFAGWETGRWNLVAVIREDEGTRFYLKRRAGWLTWCRRHFSGGQHVG